METNKTNEKMGTLLTMLTYLDKKYEFLDSLLERNYGLNRASLAKIRKGSDLPLAHKHYFKTLLAMLETLRERYRAAMDADSHREVKDLMFEVMKREFLEA